MGARQSNVGRQDCINQLTCRLQFAYSSAKSIERLVARQDSGMLFCLCVTGLISERLSK